MLLQVTARTEDLHTGKPVDVATCPVLSMAPFLRNSECWDALPKGAGSGMFVGGAEKRSQDSTG